MSSERPGILGAITQIAVTVKDLERAIRFYRDTLGLRFLFQAPPGLAMFQVGDIMLMLSTPEGEFDRPGATLYFQVEDMDRAYGELSQRGVEFIDAPHVVHRAPETELWMTFFRDPDANVLALRMVKQLGR